MVWRTSLQQYFRSHPIELLLILIGATYTIVALYSDVISLYDKPPLIVHRILFEHRKPEGMSILPPENYYRNPPGGIPYVALSLADLFSLYFPIIYFGFVAIEGFTYYRWEKKQMAQNTVF